MEKKLPFTHRIGRPPLDDDKRKDKIIYLRVDSEMHDTIVRHAQLSGRTVADDVRYCIEEIHERDKDDMKEIEELYER
jgi:(2Fe-2S) ferredoxin